MSYQKGGTFLSIKVRMKRLKGYVLLLIRRRVINNRSEQFISNFASQTTEQRRVQRVFIMFFCYKNDYYLWDLKKNGFSYKNTRIRNVLRRPFFWIFFFLTADIIIKK